MEKEIINPVSFIELTKSVTGKYGWKIKFYGEDVDEVILKIDDADAKLHRKFNAREK